MKVPKKRNFIENITDSKAAYSVVNNIMSLKRNIAEAKPCQKRLVM